MIVPFLIGKVINHLLLKGRSFLRATWFFGSIGGFGFFVLLVFQLGYAIIQIFSILTSEWWYTHLFQFAAIGNSLGIACSGVVGILTGKD